MRVLFSALVILMATSCAAVLMWWPIIGGEAVRRPLPAPAQILYLAAIGTPMIAVAMVTLANHPLYEWYAFAPRHPRSHGSSSHHDARARGR